MAEQVIKSEAIAKAVAVATRIMIQTMAEMQVQRSESQWGPTLGGPALKQPQVNWEAADKYSEWTAFTLELRNMLSTYNAQEQDKIALVKNWLGRKGLHYIESLTEAEKQACSTLQGLFDTLARNLDHNSMKPSSHCSLENCIDLRVKAQKNGWGDYAWQWLSVIIKR